MVTLLNGEVGIRGIGGGRGMEAVVEREGEMSGWVK